MAEATIREMVLALERNGQQMALDARALPIDRPSFTKLFAFSREFEAFFLFVEVIDERVDLAAEDKRDELRQRLALLRNLVASVGLKAVGDVVDLIWPATTAPLGTDGHVRQVETLVRSLKPHIAGGLTPAAIDDLAAKLAEIAAKTPSLPDFRLLRGHPATTAGEAAVPAAPRMQPQQGHHPIRLRTTRKGNLTYFKNNYMKTFEMAARELGITTKAFAQRFQLSEDRLYFILVGSDPVPPTLFRALREIMEMAGKPSATL